jgi:hypothetical protein
MDLHAEVKRLGTQLKKSEARPKNDREKDERTFFNEDFGFNAFLVLDPRPRPDFMLLNYSDSYLGT